MIVLIHDQNSIDLETVLKDSTTETVVISDNGKIRPCICCFGCWIKTPGQCIIKDGYEDMGVLLSKCDKLVIISQSFYGGYSPFIKNVLDRTVCPYMLPYFKTKKGETIHPKRYDNTISMSVHLYGDISDAERETAKKLVDKLSYGFDTHVFFYNAIDEVKGV